MKNWKTAVSMLSAVALACFAACGGNTRSSSRGDGGASSGGDGGDASGGSSSGSDSGSGSGSSSGSDSGSDSGSGPTCEKDTTGNYFVCAANQTGYYCVLSDTPVQDGLAHYCSQPTPDQTGLGFDYCCQ
jgi:hypothetical protein